MRKVKLFSIALAVVGILTLTIGSTVMAAEGDTDKSPVCSEENYGGRLGGGYLGSCTDDVAELLGLTTEEIRELRADGQSLVEIAAAQGVSEAELTAAITAAMTANLQEQVADGTITQEQADNILARLDAMVEHMINAAEVPGIRQARGAQTDGENGIAYRTGFRHGFKTGVAACNGDDNGETSQSNWTRGFSQGRGFSAGAAD